MKKIKKLKGWGIYQLNTREQKEYNFVFAVIHPDNEECSGGLEPSDTDWECFSLEEAENWIKGY